MTTSSVLIGRVIHQEDEKCYVELAVDMNTPSYMRLMLVGPSGNGATFLSTEDAHQLYASLGELIVHMLVPSFEEE